MTLARANRCPLQLARIFKKENLITYNMASKKRPLVGISVIVTHPSHPNMVLLGVRKGSTGNDMYGLPGGHLEFGESWEDCGARETLQETGLVLKNVCFATVVNAVDERVNYHSVDILVQGEVDVNYNAAPVNIEPTKCLGWNWYDWNNFPPKQQLFCPLKVLRETSVYNPFKLKPKT